MKLHLTLVVTGCIALFAAAWMMGPSARAEQPESDDAMVYELRTYTTAPGRLPDLHTRFRDHTMRIFEKHGIKNVIYTTPVDQENTLVYLIAHKSREAADRSWEAFRNDAQWQRVYKESRANGPIVTNVERKYLNPTDYSPMK